MNKKLFFILLLVPVLVFSTPRDEALKARDEAMRALKGFNPATALNEYTATPKESTLPHATEGKENDTLPSLGANALDNNPEANDIYQNSTTRPKVKPNPDSPEMRYAESLLENPDAILHGKIGCADGSCDSSQPDISDDIQEGISRLGALTGTASDAAAHQVKNGVAAIFTGNAKECKKYPLGFRDCCSDSGWGDWVKHCPQDLQALQQAKHENRVVYLGNYKNNVLGSRHYSYCIFPSKLAAIVQIQGRGRQLGISFGTAESPNCRGLTPEELERINFSNLNLSPLTQELMARMAVPANGHIEASNQALIEQWHQEGRAHD